MPQRNKREREFTDRCRTSPADIVWVSAAKNVGIDQLRVLVRTWLV